MKNIYVIIKEGVYMQGVFGVHSTKSKALNTAKKYITDEPDDYHTFTVMKIEIDKIHNRDFYHKEIYNIKRKGVEISVEANGSEL